MMADVIKCTRRWCDATLAEVNDRSGRIEFVCRSCERNAAGLCRDCPAKLTDPRAFRCRPCAIRRRRHSDKTQQRERYWKEPGMREHVLRRRRKNYRRPAVCAKVRADNARRKRARLKQPRSAIDRSYDRAWRAQAMAKPAYRKRHDARSRKREAFKRLAVAAGLPASEWRTIEAQQKSSRLDVIAIHSRRVDGTTTRTFKRKSA